LEVGCFLALMEAASFFAGETKAEKIQRTAGIAPKN